jgi:hypothetical protein
VSCFQLVEKKMRDGTIYDAAHNNDSELLALVLFSGFLDSSDAGLPSTQDCSLIYVI